MLQASRLGHLPNMGAFPRAWGVCAAAPKVDPSDALSCSAGRTLTSVQVSSRWHGLQAVSTSTMRRFLPSILLPWTMVPPGSGRMAGSLPRAGPGGAGRLECEAGEGSLGAWRAACETVELEDVLPMGLGGTSRTVKTLAWYGDAVLKAAMANALLKDDADLESCDPSYLTRVAAGALSNKNMAAHLEHLFPSAGITKEQRARLSHECGTLLEAVVAVVHRAGLLKAVDEVACYLLDHSRGDGEGSYAYDNPKHVLLTTPALRGRLASRQVGGSSHEPVFEATASIQPPGRGKALVDKARGHTKVSAEHAAAAAVLAAAFGRRWGAEVEAAGRGAPDLPPMDAVTQTYAGKTPKAYLLELGGLVTCERTGGVEHLPVWTASAMLGGEESSLEFAGAKKDAEHAAAAAVLDAARENRKRGREVEL
mmetsp:Transcript_7175/g.24815  ORF Transcript_7175/g.24815 Transcript_7175/m.24815 type:complete len:424 (-) Transcript_7175:113-1384(-)